MIRDGEPQPHKLDRDAGAPKLGAALEWSADLENEYHRVCSFAGAARPGVMLVVTVPGFVFRVLRGVFGIERAGDYYTAHPVEWIRRFTVAAILV